MKRPNHPKDLEIYNKVFEVYCIVVEYITTRHGIEMDSRKDEKDIFKYCKGYKEYLGLFDKTSLDPYEQVTITVGKFTCSFCLFDVTDIKKEIEKRLVTPRYHKYYFDNHQKKMAA